MKRGKTYRNVLTGGTYKGGKQGSPLWCAEKLMYCWIDNPDHEQHFDKKKFSNKRATLVRSV